MTLAPTSTLSLAEVHRDEGCSGKSDHAAHVFALTVRLAGPLDLTPDELDALAEACAADEFNVRGVSDPRRQNNLRMARLFANSYHAMIHGVGMERRPAHLAVLQILRDSAGLAEAWLRRAIAAEFTLFPLGSRVLLDDGRSARVVRVDPKSPNRPVIQPDEGGPELDLARDRVLQFDAGWLVGRRNRFGG